MNPSISPIRPIHHPLINVMIDVSLKSRPSPLLRSRQNRSIASRDHSTRSESFVTVPKPRFIFHPQKKKKKEKDFFSSFSLALFRFVISFEIISTAVARTKTKGMSWKSRGPISRDCLPGRPFGGAILVEKSFFEGARIFFQLLPIREKEMRPSFLEKGNAQPILR